jgi:hypothetical protein
LVVFLQMIKKENLVKWKGYFYTFFKNVTKYSNDGTTVTCGPTTVYLEGYYNHGGQWFLTMLFVVVRTTWLGICESC